MKQNVLRRFGALVLSLAMALSLAVPAWAASGGAGDSLNVTIDDANTELTLTVGGPNGTMKANVTPVDTGGVVSYQWSCSDPNAVTITQQDDATTSFSTATLEPKNETAGSVTITVTATWTENSGSGTGTSTTKTGTATRSLKVLAAPTVNVPVTGVTLDKSALPLQVDGTGTLQASVDPANATNRDVTWMSSDPTVATVTPGANGEATVTALKEGPADITVTTAEGGFTAKCAVTVTKKIIPVTGLDFTIGSDYQMNKSDGGTREFIARLTPEGATVDDVQWESSDTSVATVKHMETTATGVRGVVTQGQAGKSVIKVTATSGGAKFDAQFTLTVSGITLGRSTLNLATGKSINLGTPTFYGEASGQRVDWSSENPAVASVTGGLVSARNQTGTTRITATTANGYSASCLVTVSEDTMGLIQTGSVGAGSPMNLANASASTVFDVNNPDQPYYSGSVVSVLNSLAQYKHKSALSYVTNLSVSTTQGVLHYSYVSEADPGAGVGSTEQYYVTGAQGLLALNQVSFVPRTTFTGNADISYTAWTAGGQSFSGTIRVPVNGSGASGGITYTSNAGEPARFKGADFSAVCQARTGRTLSYVTFYLPSSTYGTLYYNYSGQYGERVKSTTQYRLNGSELLDNVSFVPTAGYVGTVAVSYRAVSSGGTAFTGQITINVTPQAGYGSVNYTGTKRAPVYFQANDFNLACYNATNEPLNYVRFTLPSASQGTLYYNYYSGSYNNPVSAGTNYYRSGTPGVGNICFVPAANAPDTVSIPFTGIGTGGASFGGTVFIRLDGTGVAQNIQYTAYRGKAVLFQASDFNNASVAATGTTLNYVQFQLPSSNQGTLYYNYRDNGSYGSRVYAGTSYYRTGNSYQNLIGNISFLPSTSYTGASRFNYTGYAANGQSFTGTVTVQVSDPTPSDVNYTSSSASPIRLSSNTMRNACNPVLSRELSYIEITGLPAATSGQLYVNYNGFGTGTLASVGSRYYCSGSPSIDQLYFVPRGRVQGTATVTYAGYSVTGERVSGRINFNLTSSGASRYFTDMGRHTWAAAAVDYLYENDVTNGVASGQYGPNQKMLRRDFVLMLCRAFGFTGGSGYSFADVPTNAYYANAVATAKRMGIVQGDGVNFRPNSSLTRQDAMVMIKNALTAAGWSLGDGSSVDLSRFVDNREVSSYARDAVGTLVRLGAVNGDDRSRLNPRSDITRAEIAVILHFVMTM